MYSDEDVGYVIDDNYEDNDDNYVNIDNNNGYIENENFDENLDVYDNDYIEKKKPQWAVICVLLFIIGIVLLINVFFNKDGLPSIKILNDKVELKINEIIDLDVELKNNDNTNLEWQSFNEDIAKVASKGETTGISLGKTKVSVTYIHSNNKNYVDDCEIIVYRGQMGILLRDFIVDEEIRLKLGNTGQITIDFNPINAYVYSIQYQSLNEMIASVTKDGVVTANGVGETDILITINELFTKRVRIVVYKEQDKENDDNDNNNNNHQIINPSGVKFNQNVITIMVNEIQNLNYTVLPQGAKDYSVSFENSDNTVLRVNQDGTIKGLSTGNTNVTVKIDNKYKASVLVKVEPYVVYVERILLKSKGNLTLNISDNSQILYEVSPHYASNKMVSFTSSNNKVATVDTNGLIKAVGKGNCIVNIKTMDGNKTISVNVLVK